jgi:nicotinamide mononucleotide transporter
MDAIWFDALEWTAVVLGITSVLLARITHIALYPTGLLSTGIYVFICYTAGLYADMSINLWYVVMSVYGWWRWLRPVPGRAELPIAAANSRHWRVFGLLSGLGLVGIYLLLQQFTDSSVPFWDALTTALAIGAMYLMAEKKIEHWLVWILVDAASVGLYLHKGLPVSAGQFAVFTLLAAWGWFSWKRKLSAPIGTI